MSCLSRRAILAAIGATLLLSFSASDAVSDAAPDTENRKKPELTSEDLTRRAEHLFAAIARAEPDLADDFFFPKGPFLPLKDVADPARYFDQLIATYHRDVRVLHQARRDWSGAAFASFELGSPPTWVAPGKEYNRIGYYRTFHGKLAYRVGEKTHIIDVGTLISWDNRWYVTHLNPIRR